MLRVCCGHAFFAHKIRKHYNIFVVSFGCSNYHYFVLFAQLAFQHVRTLSGCRLHTQRISENVGFRVRCCAYLRISKFTTPVSQNRNLKQCVAVKCPHWQHISKIHKTNNNINSSRMFFCNFICLYICCSFSISNNSIHIIGCCCTQISHARRDEALQNTESTGERTYICLQANTRGSIK